MNKKVFFVGIGGVGVSSLAKYFYKNSYEIFGSDLSKNENILELEKEYGLKFFCKHSKKNIFNGLELLIYSPAVPENNNERVKARGLKIPEFSYPEYLGKISEKKKTFSISGTNGKTTSTTMIAEILDHFDKKTTIVMGGISKKFQSNFLSGKSNNFVVESCEFKSSFLSIKPDVIAITNITPDHLDYFSTFKNYKKVFLDFLDNYKDSQKEKILICDKKNKNLKEIIRKAKKEKIKIIDYKKYKIKEVSIPGEYNRDNARVALAVCSLLKVNLSEAEKYLKKNFIGSERRFEFIGEKNGLKIYDDYAHNPEGLKVLYSGLNEKFPERKKIAIFQPHLFSRTKYFLEDFIESLFIYDEVFLLPIYKAREDTKDFKINSKILFKKLKDKNKGKVSGNKKFFLCENFEDCLKKIKGQKYGINEILITIGAGDVDKIGQKFLKK